MKRLVQYSMQDGSTVLIEAQEDEVETNWKRVEASRSDGEAKAAISIAQETFEHAFGTITPALKHITSTLRELSPHALDLELGVRFDVQGKVFIASTALEANLTVKLHWEKENQEKP